MIELGKIQPQYIDIEKIIIGACIQSPEYCQIAIENINPQYFYLSAHSLIFDSIIKTYNSKSVINLVSISTALRESGTLKKIGGACYLTDCTKTVVATEGYEILLSKIIDAYCKRELIRLSAELIEKSYELESNSIELINSQMIELMNLSNSFDKKKMKSISEISVKNMIEIEDKANKTMSIFGIESGIQALDNVTYGFQNTDLLILAARPSTGKTALVTQFVNSISLELRATCIFSLEMSASQLENRMKVQLAKVDNDNIRNGSLSEPDIEKLRNATQDISEFSCVIDDTPGLTFSQLRTKAIKYKKENAIEIIFIDYIQLMSSDLKGQNRNSQIEEISRGLKGLAKELNIPIIALSQLSRDIERRAGDKRPQLSDLRDSGAIEQDADVVMFIYRPWVSGIKEDANRNSTENYAEIVIAKHRNGKLADIPLEWDGSMISFIDKSQKMPF